MSEERLINWVCTVPNCGWHISLNSHESDENVPECPEHKIVMVRDDIGRD